MSEVHNKINKFGTQKNNICLLALVARYNTEKGGVECVGMKRIFDFGTCLDQLVGKHTIKYPHSWRTHRGRWTPVKVLFVAFPLVFRKRWVTCEKILIPELKLILKNCMEHLSPLFFSKVFRMRY